MVDSSKSDGESEPDHENRIDLFGRVISRTIDRSCLICDPEGTPLQQTALTYLLSEQRWLDKLLTTDSGQPGIVYGFYESPKGELQAYAIETHDEVQGFIAVSSYCLVSIGFFLRAALALKSSLREVGNPEEETDASTDPVARIFARPRNPERLLHVKILTMMAMRFLTAHEMAHIVNGHLRYTLKSGPVSAMAEAKAKLSPAEALFRQTLEMDADAVAVVHCLRDVLAAEKRPELVSDSVGHPVFKKPEVALRLWLFAVYCIFRILEDDAAPVPVPLDQSSHPSPMMRIQMVMNTAYEFLSTKNLIAFASCCPVLLRRPLLTGKPHTRQS